MDFVALCLKENPGSMNEIEQFPKFTWPFQKINHSAVLPTPTYPPGTLLSFNEKSRKSPLGPPLWKTLIMSISLITISGIVSPQTKAVLSLRRVHSNRRHCHNHLQEMPHPTQHWLSPTEVQPDGSFRLHCHPSAESWEPREAAAGKASPILPLLGGQSRVCLLGAC